MDLCPIKKIPCPYSKVVHVTELNNGKVVELHLCSNCAGIFVGDNLVKSKEPEKQPVIPPGFLALMQAIMSKPIAVTTSKNSYSPCLECGFTIDDIIRTGKFGCSECYSHFKDSATSIITRCQAGVQHVGKVPKNWSERNRKKQEQEEVTLDKVEQIKNLKIKMAKAIEIENYEIASVLKKKIEELQQGNE